MPVRRYKLFIYVGSVTEGEVKGKGITVFKVDREGNFNEIQSIEVEKNPGYQVLGKDGKYLYSVHGDFNKLSSYSIGEEGKLTHLNTIEIGGDNPVHISVRPDGKFLATACFNSGHITVCEINDDGSLKGVVHEVVAEGRDENSHSFAHQAYWDKTGRYLLVPAQNREEGYGQIRVYSLSDDGNDFENVYVYRSREWDEPRHIVFHPNNRYVYLANEKGNTVTYLQFDESDGSIKALQYLPTLPETFTGESKAGAIDISKNGKYVLVTNRFHDSVAVFNADKNTGYLKFMYTVPCGGEIPRYAGFIPDGKKFYCSSWKSNNITEFTFDEERGILTTTGREIKINMPYCMTFLEK